ncbi:Rhamnolipids biosynthesis 3-oxoacyl reductase [Trichoderma ghanense]|uniref:Rhamnolipids biosynthesis 3-oxoacyl reductase n=1 Tax=Trichoderma ghanense TaxID=65468 RepID=A0ABY2HFW6_9HYPO
MDIAHLFSVKGKVVLVTGGTYSSLPVPPIANDRNLTCVLGAKGIGRMIAEGFVANGAKVYLTGRDAPACDSAAAELTKLARQSQSGGSAHALPANLQELAQCEALVRRLTELEPKGLHVLVNNAGATWGADMDSYPDHAWSKVLTLNLHRVFTLTQLCLPLLERAATREDPARVIHIGSIDGLRVPAVSNVAYAASKAGLHHMSRVMAKELGPRHVTSNVLACGPFATKMMRATLEAAGEALMEEMPRGRIGTPQDVAGASLFLASRAGAFCNGAIIRVDGGASHVSKL